MVAFESSHCQSSKIVYDTKSQAVCYFDIIVRIEEGLVLDILSGSKSVSSSPLMQEATHVELQV